MAKVKSGTLEYYYGMGRRKTAIARVRLYLNGSEVMTVNTKESAIDPVIAAPLVLVGELGKLRVSARVIGGGIQSQKEAIRLGIARALLVKNPEWRQTLKKAGLLTRDPREKERKKPGLKGARRAPQWAKR